MSKEYDIVLLPGDGIGPEVVAEARRVLETLVDAGLLELRLESIPCGGRYYLDHGREWPEGSFEACAAADAVLLGAVGHVDDSGETVRRADGELAGYEMVIGMRMKLDLFANVRPINLYEGVPHKISGSFERVWAPENVDMVIVRENTEDAYAPGAFSIERATEKEFVVSPTIITRKGAERVCQFAFELARKRAEASGGDGGTAPKVTCVDKSNIIQAHRFFRDCYDRVSARYPDVSRDYAYTDAMTQWMVREPERYDVVVAPNFSGDVISDLGSVLQGGMGVAAGGNVGHDHTMFEPIHGSAPPFAGKNQANPIAAILASRMMLNWLGERHDDPDLIRASERIETAVRDVLSESRVRTFDLGGDASTTEVGRAVAQKVEKQLREG